jgi:Leucine Rich repeats (2 copies)/Leucine Rich repeat
MSSSLEHVAPNELDSILDRARSEKWPQLILIGYDEWLDESHEEWPDSLKTAERVFRLETKIEGLAEKLRPLTWLKYLDLRGNMIDTDGALTIAASLPELTFLGLRNNKLGKGARAIAASSPELFSLDLSNNEICDEDAKALSVSFPNLTTLDLSSNHITDEGAATIAASLSNLTRLNLDYNSVGYLTSRGCSYCRARPRARRTCGSRRFRFADYRSRFTMPIINEVGTRDFWPIAAEVVTFGYGSVGTYGFRRPAVRDRWHNGKAHSDFLNRDFCQRYWVPFLTGGAIVEDDEEAERPPWWLWLVSTFQIKYVVLISLGVVIWRWLTH